MVWPARAESYLVSTPPLLHLIYDGATDDTRCATYGCAGCRRSARCGTYGRAGAGAYCATAQHALFGGAHAGATRQEQGHGHKERNDKKSQN